MILNILRKRFSCRQFQDKPIPEKIVQQMLEAARLSPSGGNEQLFVIAPDFKQLHFYRADGGRASESWRRCNPAAPRRHRTPDHGHRRECGEVQPQHLLFGAPPASIQIGEKGPLGLPRRGSEEKVEHPATHT